MNNLNYYLEQARLSRTALGHFNFATADVLRGIVEASKDAGATAVMVGTSEGEAGFVGLKEAVALVKALREELNFPVFLNADHFKSFEKCREAIDAGYDSVIIDPVVEISNTFGKDKSKSHYGAGAPGFMEKVVITKKVVDYARSVSSYILVEGELGYLKGSSQIQTKIEITPADFTKPKEAKEFVEKTGVNQLAVVFGNIHGIVTEQEEKLDIEHFKKIITAMPDVFYVLHGASGLKDEDVAASIKAGITNVHFNTELRVAYRNAIDKVFHEKPNETTPYKYLGPAVEEVKKLVTQKIHVFMGK
ncbi:MAG: class II fructose-bisphosphate aldolase [Candidatus Yanofskybacteria bacterium]|nr:class II fructose-bisphosphate aldolase [Candidatus Yanofskybacteria bacterium]